MTDVAGVPSMRCRRAYAIPWARRSKALRRSPAAAFDLEPASFCRAGGKGVEMSAEPALMSLTSVAQAIAQKKISSREVTNPVSAGLHSGNPVSRLHAIEAEAALKRPTLPMRRWRGRRKARCTALLCAQDMYYDAATWSPAARRSGAISSHHHFDGAAAAEGRRTIAWLVQMVEFAYGDRPQRALRRGA